MIPGILGIAGRLAGVGAIRGTVGKLLRKGGGSAGTAIIRRPPGLPTLPRLPGGGMTPPRLPGGLGFPGAAGGGRRISKRIAGLLAAGAVFEAGGKFYDAITGREVKQSRRINYGNIRALKRSTRRLNGAAKMYAKVLTATKGKKCGGYTIKPKGKGRRCA